MDMMVTAMGVLAAALTSLSYAPQLCKAMPRGSTADLSLLTLLALALALGLGLWVAYGFSRGDAILVLANAVGLALVGGVLGCAIRDRLSGSG